MTLEELAEKATAKGYCMVYRRPFGPGQKHYVGFTPHLTTGWNGRSDHERPGVTAAQACIEASWVLEELPRVGVDGA